MKKSEPPSAKGTFGVQDVLYILFKHKWKILLLSLLGFAGSAAVYLNRKPLYQTEAKLLLKYVLVRENVDTSLSQINAGGGMPDYVMNTEIEILKSVDLSLAVAEAVGIERILPESKGQASLADAAGTILANLEVGIVPGNNVIHVMYSNADKAMSTVIMKEFIKQYFAKHLEIHRSAAAFDMVSKQAEEARIRLKETERQLDKLKTDSGITSLAEATGALSSQRSKTLEDLMKAKAELAEAEARMKSLDQPSGLAPDGGKVAAVEPGSEAEPVRQVPPQIVAEYKSMLEIVAFLQKRDLELRIKFKPGNRLIMLNQQQMSDNEAKRRALVARYPQLTTDASLVSKDSTDPQSGLMEAQAHLAAIKARVDVYGEHLDEIKKQFNEQYAIGAEIDVMERKKQMEDAEYRSLELNLKNGYLLQHFKGKGIPVLGVEPAANVAKVAWEEKGIPSVVKFFGVETANELVATGKSADLLMGNNVMAHVPDINDFIGGLKIALKPEGVITFEFPHLQRLIDENQFDTVYHEHFSYLSFLAVEKMFAHHGLTLFDVEQLPTHGGSLRIFARHTESTAEKTVVTDRVEAMRKQETDFGLTDMETYTSFGEKVKSTKRKLLKFLIEAKEAGKSVVGYGAAAKGVTLVNYCGVRDDLVDYVVDKSPYKQDHFMPGVRIPIYGPEKIFETKPDYVLILPWNLKKEISGEMAKVREWGGRFVVPIPEVQVLD